MIHDTCLVSVGQSFFCLNSTHAFYLIQFFNMPPLKKRTGPVHHLQGSSKWSSLPFSSAASVQYVVLPWSWLGKQSLKPSNLKESPNDQPEHCFQLQPKTIISRSCCWKTCYLEHWNIALTFLSCYIFWDACAASNGNMMKTQVNWYIDECPQQKKNITFRTGFCKITDVTLPETNSQFATEK